MAAYISYDIGINDLPSIPPINGKNMFSLIMLILVNSLSFVGKKLVIYNEPIYVKLIFLEDWVKSKSNTCGLGSMFSTQLFSKRKFLPIATL